jgi:uncharacterized membrane protein YeaQ/YmgE (transglycosylase-associated protein family)
LLSPAALGCIGRQGPSDSNGVGSRHQPIAVRTPRQETRRVTANRRDETVEEETMDPVAIVIWLAIGAVAGWLAGMIMKGGGFGLVGDIIVGVVGAAIAGYLLPRLGIHIGGGLVAAIINAVIGACVLLFVLRLVKR